MKRLAIAPSALPGIADKPIAGAVCAGERVFLSGATALKPDGSIAGIGDAAAQTHAGVVLHQAHVGLELQHGVAA